MDLLELLDTRRHTREWRDEVPSAQTVDGILWKAWKVSPSKQNFMPYTVTVLDTSKSKEKRLIWGLSKKNKIHVNETHREGHDEPGENPDYDYIKSAPYVVIFSQRAPCKPSPYIQKQLEEVYDHYEQMHDTEEELSSILRTAAVEVGLFASNLTAFCLEEGIDVSYTACFPSDVKDWREVPVITHNPLLIMGLGYCKMSRRQASPLINKLDFKPEPKEIIKWL